MNQKSGKSGQKGNREEDIASVRLELYLQLRKAVIQELMRYREVEDIDLEDLLSNVLLNMDGVFHAVQEKGIRKRKNTEVHRKN